VLTDAGRVPLGARAWIADGVTGALVAADGTIDWYCPERVDGPASLYRLLDPAGSAVRVGPVRTGTGATRRLPPGRQTYRPGTAVAETELRAGGSVLRITDALPWEGPGQPPAGRIVRLVTAPGGPVDVEVEVVPGATWRPAAVSAWSEGLVMGHLVVRTGFPLEADPLDRDHPRWRGVHHLEAGASMVVTIDDARLDAHGPLSPDAARRIVDDTETAWRSWLRPLVAAGPYRGALERAAVTLRSLTSETGGPVAAATTSLARRSGGERTADDRYVRLRDAATAAGTLARAGLNEDAEAAERWLRQAVESSTLPWPSLLHADGGLVAEEEELALPGWRRSQPVVTGTPAGLLDLDLYGDVVTAVSASQTGPWGTRGAGPLAGATPALTAAADWLTDHSARPDAGVWANRGRPVRLAASAAQAWVALDGMTRRARAANPLDLDAVAWQAGALDLRRWLEREALGSDGGLQRDDTGDERTDAALLRTAWQGPWPARHPIVARTVDRVLERLASGRLLYRHSDEVDDGRAGPDSADLLASLWAVRALARLERWEEAHERLAAVLALGGDLGLLAEAADPVSGELLGNLPSTGVHLAVLDAVAALDQGPA
jgi:hypothetical protein